MAYDGRPEAATFHALEHGRAREVLADVTISKRHRLGRSPAGLFTLVLTVSGVRYYASGFTSRGSFEAVEALARGGIAAGALSIYLIDRFG